MKKIATLLLAAGLVFGAATGASAIDFKAKGQWIMSFDYGENGNFMGKNGGHTKTGFGNGEDDFEARQRVRLQLDAVASEALSATFGVEIGKNIWGKAGSDKQGGAALGADQTGIIKVRWAYLDWMVPQTDLKVRMGIQPMVLPSYTIGGSNVFWDDVAGITASYQVNDMVNITAAWARPYNDNYSGTNWSGDSDRAGYLDNLDAFALLVPLTFDGVKVTPWGMYAAIGPNTFRKSNDEGTRASDDYFGSAWKAESKGQTLSGLFPVGGARHKNFKSANNVASRHLTSYGNAWWGGLTGELTMFDPFRLAWDFNYGSVNWEDDGRLNRQGWMASLLAEYKLDWAIPGIYGWYASGDDSNPANGSERMPVISAGNSTNGFSSFAFDGEPNIARDNVIGHTMVGTWGVGARLKDMSFIEDLKHTFRVNFMGGTNSKSMAKKMSLAGLWANGTDLTDESHPSWSVGHESMYLTTGDTALELGLTNSYKMYENFTINLEADYMALWLDTGKSAWGARHRNGDAIPQTKDAWNINASFVYSF